jgi:uncharacterized protein (DUF3820 family)
LSDSTIRPETLGFDTDDLVKLATWQMPFGRYQGRVLIDLPEAYLFWFQKNDFPTGELGHLMRLCLELKIEGLDSLLKPLMNNPGNHKS